MRMELKKQENATIYTGLLSEKNQFSALPQKKEFTDGGDNKQIFVQEDKKEIYAKKLKQLRLNELLAQKEIAAKFKISQQSYAKLESGKTLFTVKKIEKICKIFGITFKEFITISGSEKQCSEAIESYNLKVLKAHYEGLLLQKEITIKELEIKLLQKK